jgi:hypothetical protein
MTGLACKPCCMANRGNSSKANRRAAPYARQRQAHEAAAVRHAEDREREAAQRHAADAMLELETKWGTRVDALHRLGESREPSSDSAANKTPRSASETS